MWAEGSIKVQNSIFHYWVKHYEEPSEDYGIDGGRISKLMLKRDGEITYSYDRGLDIAPTDKACASEKSQQDIPCPCHRPTPSSRLRSPRRTRGAPPPCRCARRRSSCRA